MNSPSCATLLPKVITFLPKVITYDSVSVGCRKKLLYDSVSVNRAVEAVLFGDLFSASVRTELPGILPY